VEETRAHINNSSLLSDSQKKQVRTSGYGHIGDGNLHLNVALPGYDESALERVLEPYVFEYVRDAKGSVSAEHGVGQQKTQFLSYTKSKEHIAYMHGIKRLFDPKGIMNPYKVLPAE